MVRDLSKLVDVILVVGVVNSLNLNWFCEIGIEVGVVSYLIVDGSEFNLVWLEYVRIVGIMVGVLVFEVFVDDVIEVVW